MCVYSVCMHVYDFCTVCQQAIKCPLKDSGRTKSAYPHACLQDAVALRYDRRQVSVRLHIRAICMCLGVICIVGGSAMSLSNTVYTHVVLPMNSMIRLVTAFANVSPKHSVHAPLAVFSCSITWLSRSSSRLHCVFRLVVSIVRFCMKKCSVVLESVLLFFCDSLLNSFPFLFSHGYVWHAISDDNCRNLTHTRCTFSRMHQEQVRQSTHTHAHTHTHTPVITCNTSDCVVCMQDPLGPIMPLRPSSKQPPRETLVLQNALVKLSSLLQVLCVCRILMWIAYITSCVRVYIHVYTYTNRYAHVCYDTTKYAVMNAWSPMHS
jgi:hypothetical protein